MASDYSADKASLVAALHGMAAAGLSPGASGNASLRGDGGMWISASGLVAANATPEDLVWVDDRGHWQGGIKPSSEWQMHQAIYRDHPQAAAVLHCHSRHATALSCQRRGIPPYHYMVAAAGSDHIPCADYALFGTEALAENVAKAMHQSKACLIANHGQITFADSPRQALELAEVVEELAAGFLLSHLCGSPTLLTNDDMQLVLKQFNHYGQSQ